MGFTKLACPSCGALVEIDENREFGFCSYCGTQIMQEKVVVEHRGSVNVEHSGSVKVDTSDFVQKSLANARRALSKEDWEEVEKYYNLVEQHAPNNMEAVFFSSYGKAMLSLTDSDYFKREQKFKVLNKSMEIISDCFETTTENKEEVLRKISAYIQKMYSVNFVYQQQAVSIDGAFNAAMGLRGTRKWCVNLLDSTKAAFITELQQIAAKNNEPYILELLNSWSEKVVAKKKINPVWIVIIIILCIVFGILFGEYHP